ncbi:MULTISPECIES: N-acetylglucosamine-6-phosphate deacetylase [Micrococcaceae]|uniref:N-acetylglucosamine-6-phosphate deacetylase n=1 Tax=unclassified Kocuria TaxID=2649579 RepID=UPI001012142B|nr:MULTISPECIES: amidohydrolase family protein [unclassified Kocuria]
MTLLIHSAHPTQVLRDLPVLSHLPRAALRGDSGTVWIVVDEDGQPVRGGLGDSFRGLPEIDAVATRVDATGLYLTAPFTDIHSHGAGGYAYEEVESLPASLKVHREHGTGRAVASLVANPLKELEASCRRIATVIESGDGVPEGVRLEGIHAEGPWLSPTHKGAHREDFLHGASLDEAKRLVEAAGGYLRQVTLAPEYDEDLAVTRYLVDQGVRVAVGHTNADYATARRAFDAGASILTHAFNAMNGIHHRRPGPVMAAMESPHVYAEVIADGVHVAPEVIAMLFRSLPERVLLITDAMSATGQSDGEYRLGSLDVHVEAGIARLATQDGSQGAIAGSTLTMDQAVRTVVSAGVSINEALIAASTRPARALGLPPWGQGLSVQLLDSKLNPVPGVIPRTSIRRPRP